MYRLCVYKMLNINIDIFISNIYKIYHVCVFLHVYVCTYIIFKNIRFQKWLLNYVPFTCKYRYIQESKWNLKDWKDYNWQDYKGYTIRQDGGGQFWCYLRPLPVEMHTAYLYAADVQSLRINKWFKE